MCRGIKISALLLVIAISGFSQIANVQFKDMKGNSYDLYELLSQGKHVLIHFSDDGWTSCPAAVPGLNNAWKTFGCTKCTDYPLLVLEVCIGRGDSKSDFTAYITKNSVQYPCVWYAEGGMKFDTITNNEGYSNPKHLIFPNKTSKELSHATWEKQLDSAGIKPHICGTAVVNNFIMQGRPAVFIRKACKESFIINAQTEGYYSIVFYAMNGRRMAVFSQKHFYAGTYTVNMPNETAAQGVYLAEIQSGTAIIREKVIVE